MLITRGPRTANRLLQDASIRHAIYLQRLKSGEANRILALLSRDVYSGVRQIIRDRVARMERLGRDTGPATTARLHEIEQSIQDVSAAMDAAREHLEEKLVQVGAAEAAWQTKAINAASPIQFDLTTPSPVTLRSLVTSRPMQGRLLRDWWGGVDTSLRGGIMRDLRVGVALGRTNDQIVASLISTSGGPIALSSRNAEAIVRTSIGHVSTHARQTTFEENDDIVKGWSWVSTLDHRTCTTCGPLDGTEWATGDGPPGPEGGQLKGSDAHWSCRCTVVPVLKSWQELGIDLNEAPAGSRASMDGVVPASVTYSDWLPKQSATLQDDVLGPTRGRLLRQGKIEVGEFVDRRGNQLTLQELMAREGLTAEDVAVRR